jgi:hypothetical protein
MECDAIDGSAAALAARDSVMFPFGEEGRLIAAITAPRAG